MNIIAYSINKEVAPCKDVVVLSKTPSNKYTANSPPVVVCNGKFVCMNVAVPNIVRVLNRRGKFVDTKLNCTTVHHISTSENAVSAKGDGGNNNNAQFYAVGDKILSIITASTLTSGELHVTLREVALPEEVRASAISSKGQLLLLGQQSVFVVDEPTGAISSVLSLPSNAVVGESSRDTIFDFHRSDELLLVRGKDALLDIVLLRDGVSVIAKPWEPHVDATPTFARFFQARAFADEPAHELHLITAARGNSEIRYWTFNRQTKRFVLKQEVNIDSGTPEPASFIVSVPPCEEYVALTSVNSALAVVVQNSRSQFKAERLTTWRTAGQALACAAYVGKFAEKVSSQTAVYDVCLILRTHDTFCKCVLDMDKVVGSLQKAATVSHNAVAKWFDGEATHGVGEASYSNGGVNAVGSGAGAALGAGGASAVERGALPAVAPPVFTQLTAVSSSLRSDNKATNAISEASAANIVRQQSQRFCQQVKQLDSDFVIVQKMSSNIMCMLQNSSLRESARNAGRDFAVRNRNRIAMLANTVHKSGQQQPEPGFMNESQRKLIFAITNIVKEVEGSTANVTAAALKVLLQRQLKTSVERVSKEMESLDVAGTASVNVSGTDAAARFRVGLSQSTSSMLAAIKKRQDSMRAAIESSSKENLALISQSSVFIDNLRAAVNDVKKEMVDVQSALSQLRAVSLAQPADPDVLTSRAIALAEQDDWAAAFTVALESSDITVLLGFLENPVFQKKNVIANLTNVIKLPLFLSLCLQLTFMLESHPATVPLRVQLLHDFFLEWDDILKSIKTQFVKNGANASTFETIKRELTTVSDALINVDTQLLDRRNRSKARLVIKLINSLISSG